MLKFFGLTYAISWVLWTLVALIPPGTPLRTAFFLPGTIPALGLAPLDPMTRSGTGKETQ